MRLSWFAALAALGAAGCPSPSVNEALVLLKVTVAANVASPVTAVQFSVADHQDLPVRMAAGDPRPGLLMFGYYFPGASGTITIVADALDANGCTIGEGRIDVTGAGAGQKVGPLDLPVARVSPAVCPQTRMDGGGDHPADAADGGDAGMDTAPDTAKKDRGEACTKDAECNLGHCTDGVCCESTCDGQCESCAEDNQKGTCVAITGKPRGTVRAQCAGTGSKCGGMCDGMNRMVCAYPDEQTTCLDARCDMGVAYGAASCDRMGACRTPTSAPCASNVCESATTCSGGCSSGNTGTACPSTQFCNAAGACETKIANGGACSTDAHCQSGACVDGTCCSVPSCGSCQECTGTGGTCVPVKSKDDPDSCANDKTCDATGTCKARPGTACTAGADCSTGNCVDSHCCVPSSCSTCQACTGGGGACVSVTGADDADTCMGTKSCDVTGACKSKQGQSCTAATDCLGGHCVDKVCCESDCTGQCEACGEKGKEGTCIAVMGDPRSGRTLCGGSGACAGSCGGTNRTACVFPDNNTTCGDPSCTAGTATSAPSCDRMGGCRPGTATPCASNQCASTMCSGGCSAASPCPSTQYCTAQGACQTKVTNGNDCSADGQCTSGHCVDLKCCGSATCGSCQSCTGPNGTCVAVKSADDPDSCKTDRTCDATGTCKINPGNTCAIDSDCSTGHCVDKHCCTAASCGTCQACTGGGGACVNVASADDPDTCMGTQTCDATGACKTKKGQACTVKEACITGNCVDNVCCESACSGQCEACGESGQLGTCVAVTGMPRSIPFRSDCTGVTTGQAAACHGTCGGSNRAACVYSGNTTLCGDPTCSNGTAAPAPTCDGTGICRAGTSGSCTSNLCANSMICAGACGASAPCPSTQYCNASGACVAKIAAGGAGCTGDGQCTTGHCVDQHCCGTASCPTCQTCTAANGLCENVSGDIGTCTGAQTCVSGTCKSKPGQTCTTGTTCTTGNCVDGFCCTQTSCSQCQSCTGGGGACVAIINAEDTVGTTCSVTKICDSSGVCKNKQGQACSFGTDCVTGQCSDSKCCNIACTGTCQSCSNTSGTCSPVTSGEDPDTCSVSKSCVAGPSCKSNPGQGCSGGGECTTGNCVNGRCCTTSSCPTCQACGASGTCQAVMDGTSCNPGMMCMSGSCVANTGCGGGAIALGCACSLPGMQACNGTAQKLKLICSGGMWITNGTCPSSPTPQNCDQTDGTCKNIIAGCSGQTNGFAFCDATIIDSRHVCGPDLVTTNDNTCGGVCSAGVCQGAVCGDHKVENTEGCDDGNTTPVDGCEPVTAPVVAARCQRSRVTSIAMGDTFVCALYYGGYVRCWGDNSVGELGLGHSNFQGNFKPYQLTNASGGAAGPIAFGSSTAAVTQIAAGTAFACALLSDGTVWCWGSNDSGQLGTGSLTPGFTTLPAAVNLGGTASYIAAGGATACAVMSTGSVRCWGSNAASRLGLGDNTMFPSMTTTPNNIGPVMLGTTASAVAVANAGPCALLTNGTLRCWGDNNFGELGLGNKTALSNTMVPTAYAVVPFPTGKTPVSVTTGSGYLCSRLNDGSAQCWGRNNLGQLGLGNTNNIGDDESGNLGVVATGTTETMLVAGAFHVCAVFASDGGLRCWGDNARGQLGYPDTTQRGSTGTTTPAQIGAVSFGSGRSVVSVFPGNGATCVILDNNEVRCWGWNNNGQLGLGMVSTTAPDYVGGSAATSPANASATSVQVLPP